MEKEENERAVYEVGYHIVPTVEESEVPAKAAKIRGIIEEGGGQFISEELPRSMILAYDLSKIVSSKKHAFNKAYFGWIKFEAEPSCISGIRAKIEGLEEILRFLVIKTVRENIAHAPKIPMFKHASAGPAVSPQEKKTEEATEKPKASEEEIDKSIDDLVIN